MSDARVKCKSYPESRSKEDLWLQTGENKKATSYIRLHYEPIMGTYPAQISNICKK